MSKLQFPTEYYSGGQLYASYVYARDSDEAETLVLLRHIGEKIVGIGADRPPQVYFSPTKPLYPQMHYLIWLSFVCLSARLTSTSLLLSDTGVIHELIHAEDGVSTLNSDEISILHSKIAAIEQALGVTP